MNTHWEEKVLCFLISCCICLHLVYVGHSSFCSFSWTARLLAKQQDCLTKSRLIPETLHHMSFFQWCDFLQDRRTVCPKVPLFLETCIRSTFSQWCDFLQDNRVVWPKVALFQKSLHQKPFTTIPSAFVESIVPSSSENYLSENDYFSMLSTCVSLTSRQR